MHKQKAQSLQLTPSNEGWDCANYLSETVSFNFRLNYKISALTVNRSEDHKPFPLQGTYDVYR